MGTDHPDPPAADSPATAANTFSVSFVATAIAPG